MATKNAKSKLLNDSENEKLFSLFQSTSLIAAAGVAQLYITSDDDHSIWSHFNTGIVCLTRDASRRAYYIQLQCIVTKSLLWEQEIYYNFNFKNPTPFFLTFEAENGMAGFNFSDEAECSSFSRILSDKIANKNKSKSTQGSGDNKPANPQTASKERSKFQTAFKLKSNFSTSKKAKKNAKPKLEISEPQSFRHLNHIGFDPDVGFDLAKCDPSWTKLFKSLGVSQKMLSDANASNFIFDFVQQNGGIENLVNEIDNLEKEKKPIPNVKNRKPPPKPYEVDINIDDDSGSAPPPPPPPVPSGALPPPLSASSDSTSQAPIQSTESYDSKNNFLQEIAKGKALKQTLKKPANIEEANSVEDEGLVGSLVTRLAAMRLNTAGEEDSQDEGNDSWSD